MNSYCIPREARTAVWNSGYSSSATCFCRPYSTGSSIVWGGNPTTAVYLFSLSLCAVIHMIQPPRISTFCVREECISFRTVAEHTKYYYCPGQKKGYELPSLVVPCVSPSCVSSYLCTRETKGRGPSTFTWMASKSTRGPPLRHHHRVRDGQARLLLHLVDERLLMRSPRRRRREHDRDPRGFSGLGMAQYPRGWSGLRHALKQF